MKNEEYIDSLKLTVIRYQSKISGANRVSFHPGFLDLADVPTNRIFIYAKHDYQLFLMYYAPCVTTNMTTDFLLSISVRGTSLKSFLKSFTRFTRIVQTTSGWCVLSRISDDYMAPPNLIKNWITCDSFSQNTALTLGSMRVENKRRIMD